MFTLAIFYFADVLKELKEISDKKTATGPDEISAIVYKDDCSAPYMYIAKLLCLKINKSLTQGIATSIENVMCFKLPGKSNYRPIIG